MDRPIVRIKFVDMWSNWDVDTDWLVGLLQTRYELQFVDDPDLLVFSVFGTDHRAYRCTRLLVSWENRPWGFSQCDWALTCDRTRAPRHRWLPLWMAVRDQTSAPTIDVDGTSRGFAGVVVSNRRAAYRDHLHDLMETVGPVASGGRHRNNVGGPVTDKVEFLSRYRFGLACENSRWPGYTTEKLFEALRAGTIPIYWGDPQVGDVFNSRRIIDVTSFPSEKAFVARVRELEANPDLYERMRREPWFAGGAEPSEADSQSLLDWFERVRTDRRRPIGSRSRWSPGLVVLRLGDSVRGFNRRRVTTSLGAELRRMARNVKRRLRQAALP